jgi:hypothetical protein
MDKRPMPTKWKRPSIDTKYHIDFDWWKASGKDIRVAVRAQLCADCQARFPDHRNTESVDWVDPETAEVVQADALIQCLRGECAKKPDFLSRTNPLITNVFRLFLLSGNQPLSPRDLSAQIPWQEPETILRTLSSPTIYMGIRPAPED